MIQYYVEHLDEWMVELETHPEENSKVATGEGDAWADYVEIMNGLEESSTKELAIEKYSEMVLDIDDCNWLIREYEKGDFKSMINEKIVADYDLCQQSSMGISDAKTQDIYTMEF